MTDEERIVLALEAAPGVEVPPDFAARVMARVPARPLLRAGRRTAYGRHAMLVCALVLCAVMLAVLPAATRGSLEWIALEWIALTQLAGIVLWWSLRQAGHGL